MDCSSKTKTVIGLPSYLFYCNDAKKVGGVGADVERVPSVSIDDAVPHLGVDPDVPVLRPDPTHHRPHGSRLGDAHLIQPWEKKKHTLTESSSSCHTSSICFTLIRPLDGAKPLPSIPSNSHLRQLKINGSINASQLGYILSRGPASISSTV